MPTRAVRIGRPIAMSEPNAMSSTTIAARTPTTSLAGHEALAEPAPGELDVDATVSESGLASASMRLAVAAASLPGSFAVVIGAIATLLLATAGVHPRRAHPGACATFGQVGVDAGTVLADVAEHDLGLVAVALRELVGEHVVRSLRIGPGQPTGCRIASRERGPGDDRPNT